MAKNKAAITQKLSLSATGILDITDNGIFVENVDTGEAFDLKDLLSEFADKTIKLSVTYDYDYGTDADEE
jgi:hypothetical protein